ncbi:hypothetical protein [Amycolatopsis sp. GM8]|uniref:hypothetical protein n=1 Tax=Amycolatopsis sp. GM8 TaxID=2896530 RepID=UPI001F1F6160|nr:hypothetical protein [Amycolatopsis sp. GM8]
MVKAVADRVAAIPGVMGEVPEPTPQPGAAVHPLNDFTGRWRELWWLHSAPHPDVGPLTSRATAPIVVMHGPIDVGKTALAAQYVRRFGAAFPGGIVWRSAPAREEPTARPGSLWVLDDVEDEPGEIPSGTSCLVLTRDPRLGTGLPLGDLGEPSRLTCWRPMDSPPIRARRGSSSTPPRAARSCAPGSPNSPRTPAALTTLRQPVSPLPVTEALTRELRATGETGWELLRVLTAAVSTSSPRFPRR